MTSLATLQGEFMAALFSEGEVDPRLAIHRRGVHANLQGALAAAYPVVQRLVGQAFFAEVARRYVLATPSACGDLGEYGGGFAAFIAAYPHSLHLEYLPDVARLEWAVHESERAADAPACDFASLAAVPAELQGAIHFHLHPSVRLLRSSHPVVALWEANEAGCDGTPDRAEGADHVLVRRLAHGSRPVAVDACEWNLLAAIARGANLAEAVESSGADLVLDCALARMAAEGLVTGFEVPA